ncbi:HNH endonuclease signature motif containing protein [Ruania albidiflava]|uniref:HNH endonuclease signature motif containing protein n=1 Tax=Ruania albidiflava TaxID=366586 RepID=UPI00146DBFA5|nr:HNH endonuclease signature motif containing protein [Ruania albidiflava]
MTDSVDEAAAPPEVSLGALLRADLPVQLAALEALGEAIAGADIQDERDRYCGPELGEASIRVHRICSQLTGKRYQWLLAEEADGRWATSAFRPRTFASHVAQSHHISYANANHTIRRARQLRDEIPRFGAALRAGRVGPDHIEALATTALTSPTRIAALAEPVGSTESEGGDTPAVPDNDPDDAASTAGDDSSDPSAQHSQTVEDFLLEQARQLTVNQVRRLGHHFARVADPEADERGYRDAKQREYVELVRTLDGWHLSGFLTEENGRLIRTAMDAVMSPPAPDDERTGEQRRAQALADVAHLVLDQGLAGNRASVRPHLGVLIGAAELDQLLINAHEPDPGTPDAARSAGASWETPALADLAGIDWAGRLREQPPTFDDGTGPVPPALLRRLATCGGIYRVLFSPEGEIINHGRERRLFTPAQRRALIARDKGCTWPGCTAPPVICESHHARIHWADGGPTNTANGALLCYHHHAVVDARSISMTRRDHRWIFTRPDGSLINRDLHPPGERGIWSDTG